MENYRMNYKSQSPRRTCSSGHMSSNKNSNMCSNTNVNLNSNMNTNVYTNTNTNMDSNISSSMPSRMSSRMTQNRSQKSDNCSLSDMGLGHLPLAMAYVPYQQIGELYDCSKALKMGTIFPELCKPFCGTGGKRRC